MPVTRLDKLNEELRKSEEFKHLWNSGATFVPGDGPWKDARVMIIGEAPGKEEDKHGRPFVGQSGNMLDNALWDAGLRRSECYVTNVIKWRPAGNRTPTTLEVADAVPFLRREVVAVYPRGGIIVLLGSVALALVDETLRVSQVQGQPFSRSKWTFLPMYHPAYVLRTGKRDEWRAGWSRLKMLLEEAS